MNEEILETLKDILFQLHVVTSQNFTILTQTEGEDEASAKIREYGIQGLDREQQWMNGFLENRGGAPCASGTQS